MAPHTVTADPTLTAGLNPVAVAVDAATGRVVVADVGLLDGHGDAIGPGSLTVFNEIASKVISTVPVGQCPAALAVDSVHSRFFVANLGPLGDHHEDICPVGTGSISIYDENKPPRDAITMPVGHCPVMLAVDTAAGRIFATDLGALDDHGCPTSHGTVYIVDEDGHSRGSFPIDQSSVAVAVDSRLHQVVVANLSALGKRLCPHGPATVRMYDEKGNPVRSFPAGRYQAAVAVDAPRGRIVVVNSGSPYGDGAVSVFDEQGRKQATLAQPRLWSPVAAAIDASSGRIFIVDSRRPGASGGTLNVFDPAMKKGVAMIPVGRFPVAMALDCAAGRAVVVDGGLNAMAAGRPQKATGTVHVIDVRKECGPRPY